MSLSDQKSFAVYYVSEEALDVRNRKKLPFFQQNSMACKMDQTLSSLLTNVKNSRFLQFILSNDSYFWIYKFREMLTEKKVKAFVITTDAKASKKFYSEILGFKFLNGDEYGLEFELHNALLRISITTEEYAKPQPHTVLGWCVPDIYLSVRWLKSKGIKFERYEFLQQDDDDVWNAKSGTKVARFKDPHGNLLSIDQAG